MTRSTPRRVRPARVPDALPPDAPPGRDGGLADTEAPDDLDQTLDECATQEFLDAVVHVRGSIRGVMLG